MVVLSASVWLWHNTTFWSTDNFHWISFHFNMFLYCCPFLSSYFKLNEDYDIMAILCRAERFTGSSRGYGG